MGSRRTDIAEQPNISMFCNSDAVTIKPLGMRPVAAMEKKSKISDSRSKTNLFELEATLNVPSILGKVSLV